MIRPAPLRFTPLTEGLALYLHVPFCRSKCRYCDFYSLAGCEEEKMERLVRAELSCLDWFARALAVRSVDTVYVGGGTPGILPRRLLARLLEGVAFVSAAAPAEWTVEANPESLDAGFLEVCADSGVTRISLGLQTFDDGLLRFLGRPGTAADNKRALALLAGRWTGAWSVDLLTGLPGQDRAAALRDLDAALAAGPGHLSLYTLTSEEGTPLAGMIGRGETRLPDPESEAAVWLALVERLEAAGYRHYEVSNFARPGRESRHNLHYWRLDPYVGVGPGAVSTLGGEDGRPLRLSAARRLEDCLGGEPESYLATERLADREIFLDHLLMGLRLEEGISRPLFLRRFGRGLDAILGETWTRWREAGLADEDDAGWRGTRSGRLVLDSLLRETVAALPEGADIEGVRLNWP